MEVENLMRAILVQDEILKTKKDIGIIEDSIDYIKQLKGDNYTLRLNQKKVNIDTKDLVFFLNVQKNKKKSKISILENEFSIL